MDYANLPHLPGIVNGFKLRMETAKALSQVEVLDASGADATGLAQQLVEFFSGCLMSATDITMGPPPKPQTNKGSKGKAGKGNL